jgi:hypothetical protein
MCNLTAAPNITREIWCVTASAQVYRAIHWETKHSLSALSWFFFLRRARASAGLRSLLPWFFYAPLTLLMYEEYMSYTGAEVFLTDWLRRAGIFSSTFLSAPAFFVHAIGEYVWPKYVVENKKRTYSVCLDCFTGDWITQRYDIAQISLKSFGLKGRQIISVPGAPTQLQLGLHTFPYAVCVRACVRARARVCVSIYPRNVKV